MWAPRDELDGWSPILDRGSKRPFVVRDDSGMATIEPKHATRSLAADETFLSDPQERSEDQARIDAFVQASAARSSLLRHQLGAAKKLRLIETIVAEGDEVMVYGCPEHDRRAKPKGYRDAPDVICFSTRQQQILHIRHSKSP